MRLWKTHDAFFNDRIYANSKNANIYEFIQISAVVVLGYVHRLIFGLKNGQKYIYNVQNTI